MRYRGGSTPLVGTMLEWRNWQTQSLQVRPVETPWGFDSPLEHSSSTVKPWPAEPPANPELWQASSRQGDEGIDVHADVVKLVKAPR
jgi:hypothetical protein